MEFYLLFAYAILANLPIGIGAVKKRSLRVPDGLITAAITGILVFLAHPVLWGLMLSFFASSSYLSKYKETTNEKSKAMLYAEKGGPQMNEKSNSESQV